MSADVVVYAIGIVASSACAAVDLDKAEVEASVNAQHPTGISSSWAVADEPFATGQPNPCPCEQDASRRHWLLQC